MAKETKLINVGLLSAFKDNMDCVITGITGGLTALTTTNKDNLVGAINDVNASADNASASAQTAVMAAAAAQEAADNAAISAQTAMELYEIASMEDINSLFGPSAPSHDYVEIGGVKWATMNIGASSPTDFGYLYAWADTQGHDSSYIFDWNNYKYGTANNLTKYNSTDGYNEILPDDDVVNAEWGGNWRMPTETEYQGLISSSNYSYVSDYQGSGVNGYLFTDKTDNTKSIFIPLEDTAGGYMAFMWSSSLSSSYDSAYVAEMQYDAGYTYITASEITERYTGCYIRGVLDE